MSVIVENMQWIMLVSGLLTLTMLQAVFSPGTAMQAIFGEELAGPAAKLVVRNWGGLIAGGGAMLIYAAFNPEWRPLVLIFTGAGKLMFIALVLTHGRKFLSRQAGVAVALDSVMLALFVAYLIPSL
ncbi:MAG: DUF4345 family protein [Terricaulis sp.]